MKGCSVDGCERLHSARGWCSAHYQRFRREAGGTLPRVTTYGMPLEDRVLTFFTKGEGCWIWRTTNGSGYGVIKVSRRMRAAHVVMYELMVGPVPPGMLVDHRCRQRACVRPEHLRLATNKQNLENLSGANRNNASSGVRGVTWSKRTEKWAASVRHNYTRYNLGYFPSIAEAEAAVIAKRNELFTHNDADRKKA